VSVSRIQSNPSVSDVSTQAADPAHTVVGIATVASFGQIVRRRWKFVALITIVVFGLGVVYSLNETKQYRAEALVELSRTDLAATVTGTPGTTLLGTDFSRLAQTDATVASSEPIAAQAIKAVHAGVSARALLANSSVTSSPDTDLLTFEVNSVNPSQAIKLANAYARAYTQFQGQLDTAAVQSAVRGLSAQIAGFQRQGKSPPAALTGRASELEVLRTLQASSTTVARPATSAPQVKPTPVRDAVLAAVAGLLLGLLGAFARDALDTRVTDENEISSRLGWPLLARLPTPSRSIRKSGAVASLAEPGGPDAEAVRILRAQVTYALRASGAKTVAITSAEVAEGKSTTAANLAVAIAQAGSHVVLLEMDLRRPSLARMFDLPSTTPGVSEVIFGDVPIRDALQQISLTSPDASGNGRTDSGRGSLQLLVAGAALANVGELMGSDLVCRLIQDAADHADLVLIDTPPVVGIGDVSSLAQCVEAVLTVSRIGAVKRRALEELRRTITALPYRPLGVALTGVEGQLSQRYGYGYGYYSSRSPAAGANSREGALDVETDVNVSR
jgi:polysaccharide biosynthesis transport protein